MRDQHCRIPFTCIECPIRQVQMSCWLNTDLGDWKFWDRRNKKWPVINNQKQQNRGILMDLCRKSGCNPEILKYVLIAKAYSAERCLCHHADPFPKYIPDIPFVQGQLKSAKTGTDDYGFALDHWFPKYVLHHLTKGQGDDQKPKIFDKIPEDWLNKFYDLYNSTVGPKPEDQLELYLQDLIHRDQMENQRRKGTQDDDEIEDYHIDWEGRFEQPAEEGEGGEKQEITNNNEYKDKRYKLEARKSTIANTKQKHSSSEARKSHIHNPVDIFYFDPLSETRKTAKVILSGNLGPTKYRPPPEEDPNRTQLRYTRSNLPRIGNFGRRSTSVNSRSINSLFRRGFESLYPRQWATNGSMTSHLQRRQSRVSIKRQIFRTSIKSKSRASIAPRKSYFHSYGYT